MSQSIPTQKWSEIMTQFGRAVRTRRHQLGISQEELGHRANLHRTYVADVERGARNLSLQSIIKLSEGLDYSLLELAMDVESISSREIGGANGRPRGNGASAVPSGNPLGR